MRKLFTIVALLLASISSAQDAPLTFKATEVVPGIYMLEGDGAFAGGNITLLVGDDYNVLIDDAIASFAPALIETATELAGGPIDFVINTHVHGDHVGGNSALSDTGAIVFAHDNIRKRLADDPTEAGGPGGLPVVTFSDAVNFHVNGLDAYVFHVARAHTDGDAVIEFRGANVIHAGDVHFNYLFPYIDLDNGGSVAGYLAAQRRIMALASDDTIIIPGHGPIASKADLQAAIDVLVDSEARVKALVLEGKTEDEILAANPLSSYHDTWSWGFITTEKMTRTLYRSLTSE
ncbi:MAG: MBL fold metallo-hydrolase [Gammaproteobacteria bacterium]|nr:MBL fold metallo-hydrolase [Gammaproteobacteria bacterium]MDH3431103.1 MBL fold metallo-hydrolase [Gammaproteobacteria bacterium]